MDRAPESESRLAATMHIFSIFAPWTAPLVGLIVSGNKPYLRFHSLSSFISQIITAVILGTVALISLAHTAYTLYGAWQSGEINWWNVILKSVGVWLALALFGLINTILSIIRAKSALSGRDIGGRMPSDKIARRLTRIDQPGAITRRF